MKKIKTTPTPTERLNAIGIDPMCDYVCNGDSLFAWTKLNGFAYNTVCDWINADSTRAEKYARAKEVREIATFEQLDDIGNQAAACESSVTVQGLRLKADNIKWKLCRMNPKRYGDKIEVAGNQERPLAIMAIQAESLTDEQLRAISAIKINGG